MTTSSDQPPLSRRAARESERARAEREGAPTLVPAPSGVEGEAESVDAPGPAGPDAPAPRGSRRAAEPLLYVTQSRPPIPTYGGPSFRAEPTPERDDASDGLPPTEAIPTLPGSAFRVRDFSPEGRRAATEVVPSAAADAAEHRDDGDLGYQTQGGGFLGGHAAPIAAPPVVPPAPPTPVVAVEHDRRPAEATMTRRELRALRAAEEAARAHQAGDDGPGDGADRSDAVDFLLKSGPIDLPYLATAGSVPLAPPPGLDARPGLNAHPGLDARRGDSAPAPLVEPPRDDSATGRRTRASWTPVPAPGRPELGVDPPRTSDAAGGSDSSGAAHSHSARDAVQAADAQPADAQPADAQPANAQLDALAEFEQLIGAASDGDSAVETEEGDGEPEGVAEPERADAGAPRAAVSPPPLVEPEPPTASASTLFPWLARGSSPDTSADDSSTGERERALLEGVSPGDRAQPERRDAQRSDAERPGTEPGTERGATERPEPERAKPERAEPELAESQRAASAHTAPEHPTPERAEPDRLPVTTTPTDGGPGRTAPAPAGSPGAATSTPLPTSSSSGPAPDLAPEPPHGHWSRQVDLGEHEQPGGGSTGSIATNSLVMPPPGPADFYSLSTGEIMVTGSIDLPRSIGSTGAHPDRLDDSGIDHVLEPGDREVSAADSAPVRAVRAVSSHTSTRGMVAASRPKNTKLLYGVLATASGSALVVATVLIVNLVNGNL